MIDLALVAAVLAASAAGGRLAQAKALPPLVGTMVVAVVAGALVSWAGTPLDGGGLAGTGRTVGLLGELGALALATSIGLRLDLPAMGRVGRWEAIVAAGGVVIPMLTVAGALLALGAGAGAVAAGGVLGGASVPLTRAVLDRMGAGGTREAAVVEVGGSIGAALAVGVVLAVSMPSGGGAAPWLLAAGAGLAGGATVAGLRARADLARRIRAVADTGVILFAPFLFLSVGVDSSIDLGVDRLGAIGLVAALAIGTTLAGAVAGSVTAGRRWDEGMVVGAGLVGRGGLALLLAHGALQSGVLAPDLYTTLVAAVLVTTAVGPMLVTVAVRRRSRTGGLELLRPRTGTIVVGAGPVARILAKVLRAGGPVTLVDSNPATCEAGILEGLTVVAGSAVEPDVLEEAGAASAATVIALTPNVETNAAVASTARRLGVPSVAAFVPDEAGGAVARVLEEAGVAGVLSRDVDLLGWDRAVERGAVSERSIVVDAAPPSGRSAAGPSGVRPGDEVLPLAVVSDAGRRAWTDESTLSPGDRVVVLVRSPDHDRPPRPALSI